MFLCVRASASRIATRDSNQLIPKRSLERGHNLCADRGSRDHSPMQRRSRTHGAMASDDRLDEHFAVAPVLRLLDRLDERLKRMAPGDRMFHADPSRGHECDYVRKIPRTAVTERAVNGGGFQLVIDETELSGACIHADHSHLASD